MNNTENARGQNRYNPNYLYFDMYESKNEVSGQNNFTPLHFTESRTTSIIPLASMYKMAVDRFYVDTQCLPCIIPVVKYNSGDADELSYSFTMTYDDGVNPVIETTQTHVMFVPDNKNVNKPAPPSSQPYGLQALNSPYYYIYSFQSMIRMLNTTLATCFDELHTLVGNKLNSVDAPVIDWDNENKKAIFYTRQSHYDESIIPALNKPKINVYMNNSLFSILSTFDSEDLNLAPNGKHYRIIFDSYNNIRADTYTKSNDLWIRTPQELSTITNWSPVQSVAFVSTLPIQSTLLSTPSVSVNGQKYNQLNSDNNQQNILTDFATSEDAYKPFLEYSAGGMYRWIDLISDSDIRDINIRVLWKDKKTGIYRDLYLRPNTNASIKILFQKKGII